MDDNKALDFTFQAIGIVSSCFKEKFATPRQALLVPSSFASISLFPDFSPPEALRGLEDFSHIWVLFVFHKNISSSWHPTVRPPRLGGNRRMGVYATRSPFRPNPIGLSLVKLEGIKKEGRGVSLEISGVDFIDKTPVLDIKPYIPQVDFLKQVRAGFTEKAPELFLNVFFSPLVEAKCEREFSERGIDLKTLITETLSRDTRPAYSDKKGPFATKLADYELFWLYTDYGVLVTELIYLK